MMKSELIKRLKQGVDEWNQFVLRSGPRFRADLSGANLSRAKLNGANLSGVDLSRADLRGANLSGAKLDEANLDEANLSRADLRGANLDEANLSRADLRGANLDGANLSKVNLFEAKFSAKDLSGGYLSGVNLSGADLSGAKFSAKDLSGADLTGADLSGADLSGAKLVKADLSRANLDGAYLNGADLTGADLSRADLSYAKLYRANLSRANLGGANLTKAYLNWANLKETLFSSKFVLNVLRYPLTDNQVISAIFEDETEKFQKDELKALKLTSLKIEIEDSIYWDLMDFGLFFLCLQKTYNNVLYLMTTDETDVEIIKGQINRWHPKAEDNIVLNSIETGSWIIDILQSTSQFQPFIKYVGLVTGAYYTASKVLELYKKTLAIREQKIDIAKKEQDLKEKHLINNQAEIKNRSLLALTQELPVEFNDLLKREISKIDFEKLDNSVIKNYEVELFMLASELMVKIFIKLQHAGVKNIKFKLIEDEKKMDNINTSDP